MTSLMLAGLLVVSLVILDYIRRLVIWWVMWWVRFLVRLVFWGSVVFVGFYVYNFGLEQTVQDAGRLGGFAMGFAEQVWLMVEGANGGRASGGNSAGWNIKTQERGANGRWW